jgi:hypothetical protein
MGYQVIYEDIKSSYLDLHITTLIDANNFIFAGSPSKRIEGVTRRSPQVSWKSHQSHLSIYLGKATKVTNSQSTSRGIQLTVNTERMGSISKSEIIQEK